MARTEVRTREIKDAEVRRADLNTVSSGDAVITKVIAGNNIAITETGADSGTGDVTISVPSITNNVYYREIYTFEEVNSSNRYLQVGSSESAGYTMSKDGVIKAITKWASNSDNKALQIRINEVTVHTFNVTSETDYDDTLNIPISQGDTLRVFSTSDVNDNDVVVVEVEFPIAIAALKGDTGPAGQSGHSGFDFLTGNGAPGGAVGQDGDVYLDNLSGDFYRKSGGVWSYESNFKGPAGGIAPLIMVTNDTMTNCNSSTTGNQAANLNTTPVIESSGSIFTVTPDGVVVGVNGIYEVHVSLYQNGYSTRSNVAVSVTKNNNATNRKGASAYIRDTGGHNESSSTITEPIQAVAGDKIGFKMYRMAGYGTVTAPASTTVFYIKKVG